MPVSPRARALLAALVLARVGLGAARLAADPARFWNDEEAYNATEAWLLARAPLWDQVLALQYRSFCGGCTVVAALGAPLLATTQALWAWKALALAWTAAIHVAGFAALDALVGRAAAWAFAALWAVPPPGALDLSLMLWGNHPESALFAVLPLLLLARGRGAWAALVLGLGVWFTRTALYPAVVLLPIAVYATRGRALLGFAAGLAPLLLPAAEGDAGFYRMGDAVGGVDPLARAATLLSPREVAARLWAPAQEMGLAAALALAGAGVGGAWALRDRRAWPVVAMAVAYAVAYSVTNFPLFLTGPAAPVNNLRYHAPWAFLLVLGTATGAGVAWAAGWRRAAGLGMGLVAAAHVAGLVTLGWAPDARITELRATSPSEFVAVATARLSPDVLARPVADPGAAAVMGRMRGLRLGEAARQGTGTVREGVASAGGDVHVLAGLGEALVEPCDGARAAGRWLEGLGEGDAAAVGRGMGVTMGLCPRRGGDVRERVAALRTDAGCPTCSAAGALAVATCRAPVAACLLERVADLPEAEEVLFGAGRAWADPRRAPSEIAAVAAGLGERGAAFLAGAADPAAGTRVPWRRAGQAPR